MKEEKKSGIEANTTHSTSIPIASLQQILELLIENLMRVSRDVSAGNKSAKEIQQHIVCYI